MKEVIMAFINEWVEENDEREFAIPGYRKSYTPTAWTIDRERNVILFEYANGGEYLPDLFKFALVVNDKIYCYEMGRYIKGNNITWRGGFGTKRNDIQYTKEVDELFKEALKVYGDCGSPFEKLEDVDVYLDRTEEFDLII
jgi:hypothetical protein